MHKLSLLPKIDSPKDIKKLNTNALRKLSTEVGRYIQDVVENVGGHYSSPLGVVDLTIALHYLYNSPSDKIIWDLSLIHI